MEIFSLLSFLIIFPIAALIVGVVYAVLFYRSSSWFCLFTACCWSAYAVYESLMYMRILCSGECNIRVDLLLIYPFLLLISLIAVILYFVKRKKRMANNEA